MAEEKKWRPSRMFLQWSFSYLIITVIALLIMLFSGYRYMDALRENLEYTNGIQLDMTRVWLDQKVELLRNITAKESFSDSIASLQKATDYDQMPRYDYYQLTKEVTSDVLDYGISDTYFLYFPGIDAMVSNAYYGQSQWFYDISLSAYGISYEDWMDILQQDYGSTQVFEPNLQNPQGQNYLILVRPINVNGIRKEKRTYAVLMVDIDELIQASNWLSQDALCIVDRNMDKIVSNQPVSANVAQKLMERFGRKDGKKITVAEHAVENGMYISMISSSYENWDIAVVIQEQRFASKILDVQMFLLCMVVIYLVLIGLVFFNSTKKHYGRLKNIVNALSKDNPDDSDTPYDAYAFIDSNVQKLVKANVESSDTIERQRNAISRELFLAMVASPNAAAEVNEEALLRNGFPVRKDQSYYLMGYRLEEQEPDTAEDLNKVLEMEWFILRNVTEECLGVKGLKNLCFRKGDTQIYIIWSDHPDDTVPESIQWAYQFCRTFLAQHFDFRYAVAISRAHTEIPGMYRAYRELRQVYQYQRRNNDPETVVYDEAVLPAKETLVQYPADAENRLTLAVRSADQAAACDQIRAVMKVNREHYLTPAAMQFLTGKMMAGIVGEAEELSGDPEIVEAQNQIMEVCQREETDQLEQALCALAELVCSKLRNRNQKIREDERSRFYFEIRHYIDINYSDPGLNVNSVAGHFGRPAPMISRYFKEMSGMNLTQYIHRVRLTHVKQKLMQGEKLESIAIACGFGSQRSFLRIFKQYEGVTPSQYKDLHGKEGTENEDV